MRLVPPRPEHAELWWAWREEPEGRRNNPYEDCTLAELRRRCIPADFDDPARALQRWMVEVDGAIVGTVSLHSLNARMMTAEVGYQIGAPHAGRGLATQAVKLLARAAFDAGYRRLMALIAAENVASQRVVEKVGFQREGVLRNHFLIQGREVDEVAYGLLRAELQP